MSKSKKNSKPQHTIILTGTLDISRNGMGYVTVEGHEKDIMVRPNDLNRAFNGDTVKVQINKHASLNKRVEGKITEVVQRKQTTFTGILQANKGFAFFVASGDRPMPDFYIPSDKLNGAEDGNRVIVKLVKWDKDDKKPQGEVTGKLDASGVSDLAMKEILLEAGFPLSFDDDVLEEAARLPELITREEERKRKDFRIY